MKKDATFLVRCLELCQYRRLCSFKYDAIDKQQELQEVTVAYSRYNPGTCLQVLQKSSSSLRQVSGF